MAQDRFPASLDGFTLDLETVADSDRIAIIEQSPPGRDGAILQHQGELAFTARFRAHFFEAGYEQFFAFRDHIRASHELKEISHPKYGLMSGQVKNLDTTHDNKLRLASVDFTFVQDLTSQEAPSQPFVQIDDAAEAAFIQGQQQAADAITADIDAVAGAETSVLLSQELDPDLPFTAQFVGISTTTRNFVRQLEVWANLWDGILIDVTAPATSLVSTINYGDDLIGRFLGPLSRACERVAVSAETLRGAQQQYLQTIRTGLIDLQNQSQDAADSIIGSGPREDYGDLGFNYAVIQSAHQLAASTGEVFSADEDQRDKSRNVESRDAFDLLGNYTAVTQPDQLLTAADLDQILALVRAEIQRAMDIDSTQQALRATARNLLDHVADTKLESQRIITIHVDQPTPIELVLLGQGLPYTAAERVLALNQVENPNFVQGDFRIYSS